MSDKRYYWLKLKDDFFEQDEVKIVENMQNGKDYIIFYLKLILKSINSNGELRFKDTIPYNEEMLSTITNTNIDVVRSAVRLFEQLGMMEKWDDGTLFMTETRNMIGSESSSAARVRRHRAQQPRIENKNDDAPQAKTNAERQRAFRAKKSCEEKQHIPFIEDYINNKRYSGNYYIVLKRDAYKCITCQSIENLCVHHIDGYDENKPENNEENKMITLCRKCHSNVHSGVKIPNDTLDSIDYFDDVTLPSNVTVTSGNGEVTNCNTEIDTEKEKEKEIERDIEKDTEQEQKSKYSPEFERWWNLYLRKQGKGQAYKVWKRDKLDKRIDELLEKLEEQNKYQFSHTDIQYIPHPSTYLNGSRYDDEIENPTPPNPPKGSSRNGSVVQNAMERYK